MTTSSAQTKHDGTQQGDNTAVSEVVRRTLASGSALEALGRGGRGGLLLTMAAGLESRRSELVATATRETHLARDVLDAEITRTAHQLRFFSTVLRDGAFEEIIIDERPGRSGVIARRLVPLGPVAVFGASNFPFAYGVAGGDTASALAAGCPVVVKEHPAHKRTCRLVLSCLQDAATAHGLPRDVVSMVSGLPAGAELVQDPRIAAVGFTGSVAGGRALHDLCAARPSPVPFFGELGSVNPVVVMPHAASACSPDVMQALLDSLLVRAGQVCTKGGLIFIPTHGADEVAAGLRRHITAQPAQVLLHAGIRDAFLTMSTSRAQLEAVSVLAGDVSPPRGANAVTPMLLSTSVDGLLDPSNEDLLEECFGPFAVLVEYETVDDLLRALTRTTPSLVAAVHSTDADQAALAQVLPRLVANAGRVVWNGPTTGLAVGWATHHSGAYPASTSVGSTSVGSTSIRRWMRPVALEGWPSASLPVEFTHALEDQHDGLGRVYRDNGKLHVHHAQEFT